ncbi:MAG: hypothetical protein HC927_00690, partial [Deltaproteobacteria bacterium]|nr:hypothetical protein [Deltaproteobacteria bacterium]
VPIWSAIPAAEARARLIRIVGGEHRAMVGGSTVVSILDDLAKTSDLEQIIAEHDKRAEPASAEDESQSALWQMAEDDSPADKTAVVQAFAAFLANG